MSLGVKNKIIKIVKKQPRMILSTISPRLVSHLLYFKTFKQVLNLKNPKTFNEKLMWLKLNTYYNNPLVTQCADKYLVRQYVKDLGCGEILNDLIGVWDSEEEIQWDSLPNKFAIKCNHGCGYNIICNDKSKLDITKAQKTLSSWLSEDFWKISAEVNYKYIPKKIICEKFIESKEGLLPPDFKFYCFNGKALFVMVCLEREKGKTRYYYFNKDWEMLNYSSDAKEIPEELLNKKPKGMDEMFEYANKLAGPFPFVRVDFYLNDGKVLFGELTFSPARALDNEIFPQTDLMLGKLINLPPQLHIK